MERALSSDVHPALLPVGTQVGPWRVEGWAGSGSHGAVYRAVRTGQEQAPPVALKLAVLPRDPCFAREVELLSRQHHPNMPQLIDTGDWQHPGGTLHPYIAMEWIDGVTLYDWARLFHPTAEQVLRMLAQVALALQTLHAQGAVHRDVKGDNILVRRSDSRVFLTDLGSGSFPGADTLTPPPLPPGTPAYRSPQAWLFALHHSLASTAVYSAGPADDIYALGVLACRLVTGRYPKLGEPRKDEDGTRRLEPMVLPKALRLEGRVEAPLRAVILRMLSEKPDQRGTAAQLAQEMERAAASLTASRAASSPRAPARAWRPWLATAAAAGALAMWAEWRVRGTSEDSPRVARTAAAADRQADVCSEGLGESAVSASGVDSSAPLVPETMAAETPPEPLPGQTQPDANGRCPRKRQVAVNGGCWMALPLNQADCEELNGHMYKGSCYAPAIPPGRPSTAPPVKQP